MSLYDEEMKDPEFAKMMDEESCILNITENIIGLMVKNNISKEKLAEKLGKDKKFIDNLLEGSINIDINILASVFNALVYLML